MIDWPVIDSVLLDMDGTLLDLHFDNYFWLEFVPQQYADKHNMSLQDAKQELFSRYKAVEGNMQWYCVDHWSDQLGLDIVSLKVEIRHKIKILPHVEEFLRQAKISRKKFYLVTNAHRKSLQLKLSETGIGEFFDEIECTHDFGVPKEHREFWPRLEEKLGFDKRRSLLIDDSLPVLRCAEQYGIKHLLSIGKPDSQAPVRHTEHYTALEDFSQILPIID